MSDRELELEPLEALRRQREGALLIDVREAGERAAGFAAGSLHLPLGQVAQGIAALAAPERELLILCAAGQRSLEAARILRGLGYRRCHSVRGGLARWQAEGRPLAKGELDAEAAERYSRHLLLPEVGLEGQRRLSHARIALVGAGGLGAPAALYLAAAGVGNLTLIDDDRVERSNLQRQIIHADARIGMPKVESARIGIAVLNPHVQVATRELRLCAANVEDLLDGHDVVIDGADNFATRYLLDAACRRLRIPLVHGAVQGFAGQVSVFDARREDSPCYRCLFPQAPAAGEAPNCSQAGVLGVLPGTIGLLQATEALKLVLGIGQVLVGRLLCYDALEMRFRELQLRRDPECASCGRHAVFGGYEDLARACAAT